MHRALRNRGILGGSVLLIVGLMVGLGLGLLLSRGIEPPGRSHRSFASLGSNTKEEYIVMVGAAYALDHDLARAQARLEQLEAPNIALWIGNLIDRYLAEERDPAQVQALMELAQGLGVSSPRVVAYQATLTRSPTDTPPPTATPFPSDTPTVTPIPPTEEPTAVPPTATPQTPPTDTPQPSATNPPTETSPPATSTQEPQATDTPMPTQTPEVKWTWTAQLVGPGQEGQSCNDGHKLIRVTVLNATGGQLPGVWVYEQYTGQYLVSGHKGEDPYWGPGEVELSGLDGGRVCIAAGEGGSCESDLTRDLPCHDPPEFEDLWAAGYCDCCETGITKERCREYFDSDDWCVGGVSHYSWRVEFRRSW